LQHHGHGVADQINALTGTERVQQLFVTPRTVEVHLSSTYR
jgi:hypothetical protein